MDFPSEEDLYDLQYQDEMELMNDMAPVDGYVEFDPFSFGPKSKSPSNKTLKSNTETSCGNSQEKICPRDISNETAVLDKSHESKESDRHDQEEVLSPKKVNTIENKLPVNRKLFSDHEPEEIDGVIIIDNYTRRDKRKISDTSDDNIEIENTAKKPCSSINVVLQKEDHAKESHQKPSFDTYSFSRDRLPLTCSDGRRVYFFINDEDEKLNKVETYSQKSFSLLPVSITKLKSQYFTMEELMLKEKDTISSKNPLSETEEVMMIDEDIQTSLWVEKYRPESYLHLLSDEGINRTLLQWLKLWDKVVFGREKKTKKKKVETKNPFEFKKPKPWGELVQDLDEHGRPFHKVAFLCGPPGLGKTTLANIIAKHAGYNVVELNASDDRNPEAFRTTLEAATQMKSVLQDDNRPNCLILDEIDGAPAASINVLMAFIKSVGVPKGKQKKKGDIPMLMRPIICICNDQYAPALKPLRQVALILNFPSSALFRLSGRLHEICSSEGLIADMAALTLLCEKAANDVRSCLSTLQFIHRKQKELSVRDVKDLKIGQKDMHKSLFAVWQDIFYFKEKKSFQNVFNTIQSFGDYDKIYAGMFENYLSAKTKTSTLNSIYQGAEWTCFGDIVQQQIAEKQLYFMLPYLPYPAVAFHILFASSSYKQMSYPSSFYEHKTKSIQLSNTLNSVMKDMVSSLKAFLSPSTLLVDIFPFLLEIMKPTLRPVSIQLYSEKEKMELRRVIDLMLSFKLNYRQERSQDGTYNYVLDPNIEELTKFSTSKTKRMLTYSLKQMIAREVDVEQMRKEDTGGGQTKHKQQSKETQNSKSIMKKNADAKAYKIKEHVDRPVLDFFGREIILPVESASDSNKDKKEDEVWFHFKEGYSNAVRKPIYIKNLM